MGSLIDHREDYNVVEALRGQRNFNTQQKLTQIPPPPEGKILANIFIALGNKGIILH